MSFTRPLLAWYAQNARQLPWRGHPDPYAVWVSEIMLQQTRVETVTPYFQRWMARFPTVATLAEADQQDVLAQWEGLGYYSRARNLHKAARLVVAAHGGKLPADVAALRKLPGIGPYTAGAIASLAFGLDAPVIDGNIRRVLARLFCLREPADSTAGTRRLWELAAEHLPPRRASDYNQGLMELGALICTPRRPRCAACPVQAHCEAHALNLQAELPILKPKPNQPHYTVTAAIITRGDKILLAQRLPDGLLGGMWEFPGGKQEPGETLPACLKREICEELGAEIEVGDAFGIYRHAYTHFRITLHAFCCTLANGEPRPIEAADLRWVTPPELSDYPMGKIDRQIAQQIADRKAKIED